MERMDNHNGRDHIINISRGNNPSTSSSLDEQHHRIEPRPSGPEQGSARQTSLPSTLNRYTRRRRSPLNSGLWISVELFVTVCQIIASIVVLLLSRHENPQVPLFAWVIGYASGCIATLPVLYWRYRNRNQTAEHESNQPRMASSRSNFSSEPNSLPREENNPTRATGSTNGQLSRSLSTRFNGLENHFKMALDCFFAIWFIVGSVWIFGGRTSPADSPKLYRLCIVFLTFSCIGYAMPFILCATICCCLPCIISLLGYREEFSQTKGAAMEIINALPVYRFKLKKNGNRDDHGSGVFASGTEKERPISGEDAVCSICLAKYADDDELRELPCFHFFHVECVDKWLKINALCPLCKCEVGDATANSATNSTRQQIERRLGNGSANLTIYGSAVF